MSLDQEEASLNLHASSTRDSPTPANRDDDVHCLVSKFEKLELDRFIPNRSTTNWDYGHAVLTERRPSERNYVEIKPGMSENSFLYSLKLKKELGVDTSRIFYYRNNREPPEEVDYAPRKKWTCMGWPVREMTATGLVTNRNYFNVLDWRVVNNNSTLAVGLQGQVYYHDIIKNERGLLFDCDDTDLVSSVSWVPEGVDKLAIGFENSLVCLVDPNTEQVIRKLDSWGVGSLAWNGRILTTGSREGHLVNYDLRVHTKVSQLPKLHRREICGLKWSASGQLLASGGSDKAVRVWDIRSMSTRCLHKQDHNATVRALAWNPLRRHLLASGGGKGDHYIRLWDAKSGTPHETAVDTRSEVCGLFWSQQHGDILFSMHGLGGSQSVPDNRLILWRSPMMFKLNEVKEPMNEPPDPTPLIQRPRLYFHSTQSPHGYDVAFGGDDETVRYSDVFERVPAKPAKQPFSSNSGPNHYTIR